MDKKCRFYQPQTIIFFLGGVKIKFITLNFFIYTYFMRQMLTHFLEGGTDCWHKTWGLEGSIWQLKAADFPTWAKFETLAWRGWGGQMPEDEIHHLKCGCFGMKNKEVLL